MPESLVLSDLINGGWNNCRFQPFRPAIEICYPLSGETGIALLRYAPGANIPRHRHTGTECILVLDGMQSDESGDYQRGTLVINPAGSEHSVWSPSGCVVLIQWHSPVEFI